MTQEEFAGKLAEDVWNQLPEHIQTQMVLRTIEVTKMNDQVLCGIAVQQADETLSPIIYTDQLYAKYINDISYEELVAECKEMCVSALTTSKSDRLSETNWEEYPGMLSARIIGAHWNHKYIQNVPSLEIAPGLLLICELRSSENERGQWRTKVQRGMMQKMGLSPERLFENSIRSAMHRNPPIMTTIHIVEDAENINLLTKETPIENKEIMYVITTADMLFGAIALFYPGVQERIAALLGEGYYAIPSSIHEFIIVPMSSDILPDELVQILNEANHTVVEENEILSYDLYYYDYEKHRLQRYEADAA